jgi:hypothetical protein
MTSKTPSERHYESQRLKDIVRKQGRVVARATLRDEFAQAALTALIVQIDNMQSTTYAKTATHAYQFAEAMLKCRKDMFEEEVVAPALTITDLKMSTSPSIADVMGFPVIKKGVPVVSDEERERNAERAALNKVRDALSTIDMNGLLYQRLMKIVDAIEFNGKVNWSGTQTGRTNTNTPLKRDDDHDIADMLVRERNDRDDEERDVDPNPHSTKYGIMRSWFGPWDLEDEK